MFVIAGLDDVINYTASGIDDPAYLAERHDIGDRDEVLAKMGRAVKGLVSAAASP